MRLALAGNGGVGKAFLALLMDRAEQLQAEGLFIQLNGVYDSRGGVFDSEGINLQKLNAYNQSGKPLADYPEGGSHQSTFSALSEQAAVDVLVELTPSNLATGEPGLGYIRAALERGWHVVTGNKGPILLAWHELNRIAEGNRVKLLVGCTAGGALPAVNGGLYDLAGARIDLIEGVLNGTTNFILEEMEKTGCEYREALIKAQEAGIAETNPAQDVEGWDAAAKILILANILMKQQLTLQDISVRGITGLTPDVIRENAVKGLTVKLVGRAVRQERGVTLSVEPEALPRSHPLSGATGKNKGVRFATDTLGELTMIGGASGTRAAAAAILRDLLWLHRWQRSAG